MRPLMTLGTMAWRSRQAARLALAAGDPPSAAEWASAAQYLHATEAGRKLRLLIELIGEIGPP